MKLKSGCHIRAPFSVEKFETYVLTVGFPTPQTPTKRSELEDATDQIDVAWQVFRNDTRIASGRSPARTWFHAGDTTGKTVGEFSAHPGSYMVEAAVLSVPSLLTGIDGRFSVLLNQRSMTDLGYTIEALPYLRYLGATLIILSMVLLACAWRTRAATA